jgi:hypothetical protein
VALPPDLKFRELVDESLRVYERYKSKVVPHSMPILFFGDLDKYKKSKNLKVITVGLNPSNREFPPESPFKRSASCRTRPRVQCQRAPLHVSKEGRNQRRCCGSTTSSVLSEYLRPDNPPGIPSESGDRTCESVLRSSDITSATGRPIILTRS